MRKLINEYGKQVIAVIILFAVITFTVGGVWLSMVGSSLDLNIKEHSNMPLKNANEINYATLKPYVNVESKSLQIGEFIKLKSLIKAYKYAPSDEFDEDNRIDNKYITVTCSASSYNKSSDIFTAEATGTFFVNYKIEVPITVDGKIQNIIGYASTTISVDNVNLNNVTTHKLNIVQDKTYVSENLGIQYLVNKNILNTDSDIKSGTKVKIVPQKSNKYNYVKTTLSYTSIEKIKKNVVFDNLQTFFIVPYDIHKTSKITLEYQYKQIPILKTDSNSDKALNTFSINAKLNQCGVEKSNITSVLFSNEIIDNYDDYLKSSGSFYNFSANKTTPIYARLVDGQLIFYSETGKFKFGENCKYLFAHLNNVKDISAINIDTVDFSNIKNAQFMFYRCYSVSNITFGFDASSYSENIAFSNIARVNFPILEKSEHMFDFCCKLQIFDMTGCESLKTLPGLHNCNEAKEIIIEYDAFETIGEKYNDVNGEYTYKMLDYNNNSLKIETFGMSSSRTLTGASYITDKIIEKYNMIYKESDSVISDFHITIANSPYDDKSTAKNFWNHINYRTDATQYSGTKDQGGAILNLQSYKQNDVRNIINLYNENNYFSFISVDCYKGTCGTDGCNYKPITNLLETYGPESFVESQNNDAITILQDMSSGEVKCPKCNNSITISYPTKQTMKKNNINYRIPFKVWFRFI